MCVLCVCTESSGADVTGSKALQRHDEPGTPAGIRGTSVYTVERILTEVHILTHRLMFKLFLVYLTLYIQSFRLFY